MSPVLSRREWSLAGDILPNAEVVWSYHKGNFLACIQAGVQQNFQVLFCQATSQMASPQHILVLGVVPPHVQGLPFPHFELCKVPLCSFLQPVEVILKGTTTIWSVSLSSQFCITCKLAEGAHYPSVPVLTPGYTTSDSHAAQLCKADHSSFSGSEKIVFSLQYQPFI